MAKEPTTKAYKASKEMADIEHKFEIRNQISRKMKENERISNSVRVRKSPRKKTGAQ